MATQQSSVATPTLILDLVNLANASCSDDPSSLWTSVETLLARHFGFSLFTALSFSPDAGVERVYTTRPDLHPLGTRQPVSRIATEPPKRGQWQQRVIVEGRPWLGSVREDLRDVFEDWELLWENGLGSVLNVPIRIRGSTIGSLNILDCEHAYDTADLGIANLVAQLIAPALDAGTSNLASLKSE